jgi:hypothetical protein
MDNRDLYGTAKRRRSIAPLAIALLIAFALGIGATAYTVSRWDQLARWLHPVKLPPPTTVTVIRPAPRAMALPAVALAAPDPEIASRLASLEGRMDAVDAQADSAAGDASRAEALLVAFAARRALDRGQPLGYIEGLLRENFGATNAPAVALVIASAQRPVTLVQLQDGFDALRPALATAAPEDSWWTGVRREFGSLFVVRRADTLSAVPADRLARAAHALEQGQVDAAAAAVARMPGSARASEWLGQARRYMLARAALDRIETAALLRPATPSPLAAPGASTTPALAPAP